MDSRQDGKRFPGCLKANARPSLSIGVGLFYFTHLTQNVPKVPLKNLVLPIKPSGRCVTSVILVAYANLHGKEADKNGYAAQFSNLSGNPYHLPVFGQPGSHAGD
jgi:hypothetical protein